MTYTAARAQMATYEATGHKVRLVELDAEGNSRE
jgi:hypothetical protein